MAIPRIPPTGQPDEHAIRVIIGEAAKRHKVQRHIALAFAFVESRLQPNAEGDLLWHQRDGGAKYTRHVLANPKFQFNPWRETANLWHSYGLFQLLACYHCTAHEDPRALLDPRLNADRGCREIARLLRAAHGDVQAARLAYTGAGYTGTNVSSIVKAETLTKLAKALQRFAEDGEQVP